MGQVVLLDELTANQIAAGEVIERPVSVVKELAENALDAGAGAITVEIKKGGISQIKVTDDGVGFSSDDVLLAFERFATSKLRSADDLGGIMTLGFRGEALPSIAAVSKVRLVTRRREDELGRLVEFHGGHLAADEEIGCPAGTTVTVSELFFNIPARYKFLKKDASETALISDLIGRLAVGRPDISFDLVSQNTRLLHTQGGGVPEDAIYAVFGKEILGGLLPISHMGSGISVAGFAGAPEVARGNRNGQMFFVNGRMIKNRILCVALEEAYKSHMMKKRYPVAVVYLTMNVDLLDVNAHPAKTEVRFFDESALFRAVYNAVMSALTVSVALPAPVFAPVSEPSAVSDTVPYVTEQKPLTDAAVSDAKPEAAEQSIKQEPVEYAVPSIEPSRSGGARTPYASAPRHVTSVNSSFLHISPLPTPSVPASDPELPVSSESASNGDFSGARFIGQLFNMYIMLERGSQLILIDQHAAHERVLFESIKKQMDARSIARQMLLASETVKLLPDEAQFVRENSVFFERSGFLVEEFGQDAVIIREVPSYLERQDTAAFFLETLELLRRAALKGKMSFSGGVYDEELLYDIACKAAIKANRKLGAEEAAALVADIEKMAKPHTCPHGRPFVITIPKREFDRRFHRE